MHFFAINQISKKQLVHVNFFVLCTSFDLTLAQIPFFISLLIQAKLN